MKAVGCSRQTPRQTGTPDSCCVQGTRGVLFPCQGQSRATPSVEWHKGCQHPVTATRRYVGTQGWHVPEQEPLDCGFCPFGSWAENKLLVFLYFVRLIKPGRFINFSEITLIGKISAALPEQCWALAAVFAFLNSFFKCVFIQQC